MQVRKQQLELDMDDVNSFFPLGSCPWIWGLEGQKCASASEKGFWLSLWRKISDFVLGDLHHVTFKGKLPSR